MMKCPCRFCTDRRINCHSHCQAYEDFKINRAAENDWNREQNENTISTSALRTHWRNMRLNKRKYSVNK